MSMTFEIEQYTSYAGFSGKSLIVALLLKSCKYCKH